jgi:hypothetical protein
VNQRGSALVVAVMVIAVLTALGLALHFQGQAELQMSSADSKSKQTFFLAESGIEAGRQALFNTNGTGPFGDDLLTAAGGDTNINFDPTTVEAVYDSDGTVSSFTGYGDDQPLIDITALGDGWYAAFLTNDAANTGGVTSMTDDNDRVMITGVGAGRDGAIRIAEAIIEPSEVFPGDIPAMITMFGASPTFGTVDNAAKVYTGDDCNGAGIPSFSAPVAGLITTPVEAVVEGALNATTVYTAAGSTGHWTVVDLTDPTDPGIVGTSLGTIDPDWIDCERFIQMADEVAAVADVVCNPGPCTLPSSAPDRVIFANGDFTLTSADSGAGLLWVTGRLYMEGAASWNGIIVVAGEGKFMRTPAGAGTVSGAMVIADLAGPDDTYGTADDCSGGFEPMTFDESLGGTGLTAYCNSDILAATPITKYSVVGFRQR